MAIYQNRSYNMLLLIIKGIRYFLLSLKCKIVNNNVPHKFKETIKKNVKQLLFDLDSISFVTGIECCCITWNIFRCSEILSLVVHCPTVGTFPFLHQKAAHDTNRETADGETNCATPVFVFQNAISARWTTAYHNNCWLLCLTSLRLYGLWCTLQIRIRIHSRGWSSLLSRRHRITWIRWWCPFVHV